MVPGFTDIVEMKSCRLKPDNLGFTQMICRKTCWGMIKLLQNSKNVFVGHKTANNGTRRLPAPMRFIPQTVKFGIKQRHFSNT